ncbi:MAG TPA: hypothetical protein VGH93_05495 [Solirubrobacteraceae bacterium]
MGWGNPHGDTDAIWNLAPHDLAIAQQVLGSLDAPRSALAEAGARGLLAVLGKEAEVVIEVSANAPLRRRELRLGCERGVAAAEGDANEVLVWHHSRPQPSVRQAPGEPPLLAELRAFVGHIGGGTAPVTGVVEAASAVRTLAELRRLAGLSL